MQVGKFDEHCDNLHEVMGRRNAKKYGHKLTFPFPVLNLPGSLGKMMKFIDM